MFRGRAFRLLVLPLLLLVPACAPRRATLSPSDLDSAAERYVRLVLAMGRHDPDYVDSYYGPPEWKAEVARDSLPLARIRAAADSLVLRLAPPVGGGDPLLALRRSFLRRQLEALAFRTRALGSGATTFDAEAAALYDAAPAVLSDSAMGARLAVLDSLLPGRGPLLPRFETLRREFRIPAGRVDTVFRAALAEARRRTLQRVALPASESFTVEFVRNRPWSGYNWYQGGFRSLIQVNLDLPLHVDQATEFACHEGYPGHHVYNALLKQALVHGRVSHQEAVALLMRYRVLPRIDADHWIQFAEHYRSFVVNYELGKRMVLAWLDSNGGDETHPDRRWNLYRGLLATPRLPRDLEGKPGRR